MKLREAVRLARAPAVASQRSFPQVSRRGRVVAPTHSLDALRCEIDSVQINRKLSSDSPVAGSEVSPHASSRSSPRSPSIGAALLPGSASAEIVKAPTGEQSRLTVNSTTDEDAQAQQGHAVAISGAAKKSGSSFALPYSLSRWDFATREGDVAHFAKNTRHQAPPRQALGRRRPPAAGPGHAHQRLRHGADRQRADQGLHRLRHARRKATDIGRAADRSTGYKLKLTQAGANYVNKGLKQQGAQALQPVRHVRPAPAQARGGPAAPGRRDGRRRRRHARPGRHARRHGDHQPRLPRPAAGRRQGHLADPADLAGPRRRRQP